MANRIGSHAPTSRPSQVHGGRDAHPNSPTQKPAGHGSVDKGERVGKSNAHWSERLPQLGESAPKLLRFVDYYKEASTPPKVPAGQTCQTFDEAQVQALHRAYWSASPTADLAQMIALARKDPAFAKRKDDVTEKQVGRLIADFPGSFPWGWRSRTLAATSYLIVEGLLGHPRGTALAEIFGKLEKLYPGFPSYGALRKAAAESWTAEPKRFPFAKLIPHENKRPVFEACGAVVGFERDRLGRLVINRTLAEKVAEVGRDPRVRYDWELETFIDLVDKEIGGGFSKATYNSLQDQFGRRADGKKAALPTFTDVRQEALGHLCQLIRELYDGKDGRAPLKLAKDIVEVLHAEYGYPLYHTTRFAEFRALFPIVPEFRAEREEGVYAEARALLDAIKAQKGKSYLEVGRALGHNDRRVGNLVFLIHKKWHDELPKEAGHERYTDADLKVLREVVDAAPVGATGEDLYQTLRGQYPDFLARHPLGSGMALNNVLRTNLGIASWTRFKQQRYSDTFADIVRRSPPGATFEELTQFMIEEVPGAYSVSGAKKLARLWDNEPEEFPAIAKLKAKDGTYPWQRARVALTQDLAKRVGTFIIDHPDKSVPDIVRLLHKDKGFAHAYPTFGVRHVHRLRVLFPRLVPFIDDLHVRGRADRQKAQLGALAKLADRAAKAVKELPSTQGLTVAALARRLRAKPHSLLKAIRQQPERFPWSRERPVGTVDAYLATRVAHEIEKAPLGMTRQQLVDALKADKTFRERYPAFNYHTACVLRERYPELVPDWNFRDQILRSKLLCDAILTAPKGTDFKTIVAGLRRQHPGQFTSGFYTTEKSLRELWESAPERFPFAAALHDGKGKIQMTGRGQKSTVDPDETIQELANRLARLDSIPERLPLLERIAEGRAKETFAGFEMVAVQHLLDSQVPTFDTYRRLGITPARCTIIGVPYSASQAVVDTLEDKGWEVRVPPLDLETWIDEIRESLHERLASARDNGKQVLVLDDGGICSELIAHDPELREYSHLFRVVEQTRRGITVADGLELRTSVVNVAQSWGKYVEGPMIAAEVDEVLLRRLERLGIEPKELRGKHVGVVGGGTIGLPIAQALRALGAKVEILDIDPKKLKKEADDFGIIDAKDPTARKKFFATQDLILGATGVRSMTAEDLAHTKKHCIVGSASSKLVEIDVVGLAALAKRSEIVDHESHPPTIRYHLKDGRTLDLLARGFPLNFDGGPESSPPDRIQLTRALMLIGALQATGAKIAGVNRLDVDLQLEVLDAFADLEGKEIHKEKHQREALSLAQLRLQEAQKKRGLDERRHGG